MTGSGCQIKSRSRHIILSLKGAPLSEVGIQDVLLKHPLGVEEGSIQGDGVPHHVNKPIPFLMEERDYHLFQFLI